MKNCIQGNLIIFTISGKCGGKDEPENPCCQRDSDDYRKLMMSEMKSKQDNLFTEIIAENPVGIIRKSLLLKGWRRFLIKIVGILINSLRDNITAVFVPGKRRKPSLSAGCVNW
jgi:hypothetical protein